MQVEDYYPFGLSFNSYQRVTSKENDYLYNGKELQDELDLNWLDYGARMYDPAIGRWLVVDPMADKYIKISPYAYVANVPTLLVDPDGMQVEYNTETREQKKLIKRQIRKAKKSKTFREMWREMKRDKDHTWTIHSKGDYNAMTGYGAKYSGNYGTATTVEGPDNSTVEVTVKTDSPGGDIFVNTEVVEGSDGKDGPSQAIAQSLQNTEDQKMEY